MSLSKRDIVLFWSLTMKRLTNLALEVGDSDKPARKISIPFITMRIWGTTREVTQNLLTSMRKAIVTHYWYTQVSLFTCHYIYGTCSNLFNPIQGATHTAFWNLISPFYEDGVDDEIILLLDLPQMILSRCIILSLQFLQILWILCTMSNSKLRPLELEIATFNAFSMQFETSA